MRLNKFIASTGYCSRRKADELIEAGKVRVNGKDPELGQQVSEADKITVNGKAIRQPKNKVHIMFHKPAGYITTKSDPHHNQTVMKLLPKEFQNLKPAGRLDKESEGLLILSNDGEYIQKLTHPKHKHTKTYEVLVKGWFKPEQLEPLKNGTLKLDGYTLNPMDYEILSSTDDRKTWVRLTLTEGRKRQIRRVMDQLGYPVIYLKRVSIGQLRLGKLPKNDYQILTEEDVRKSLLPSVRK